MPQRRITEIVAKLVANLLKCSILHISAAAGRPSAAGKVKAPAAALSKARPLRRPVRESKCASPSCARVSSRTVLLLRRATNGAKRSATMPHKTIPKA
jgi:hypothetical protein